MRPAGLAAFEARTAANTAIYSYERAAAAFSADEEARFRANPAAWADWEARPPSYRRAVTHWVTSAKAGGDPGTPARRPDRRLGGGPQGRADALVARDMTPEIAAALEDAIERLRALELGDAFEPRAAEAIVGAGLHRLCVPTDAGGLGASLAEAAEVLMALGAVDGSTALGFAMQVHVTGAMRDREAPFDATRRPVPRDRRGRGAAEQRRDRGGRRLAGPRRHPGTPAEPDGDGTWRLTGEKTWTTWLPNLTHVFVTARFGIDDEVGRFIVRLDDPGVRRREGFEALGMRGSASGRLVLDERSARRSSRASPPDRARRSARAGAAGLVRDRDRGDVPRDRRRRAGGRRALGQGPPARRRLDGRGRASRACSFGSVAWTPSCGRHGSWSWTSPVAGMSGREADDVALAKLVATRAAVNATDEALRIAGGPGFLAGRLERAFRDARAGLINPPLEDVAYQGFAKALIERQPES